MKRHAIRLTEAATALPREAELAWQIAVVAADAMTVVGDMAERVGSLILDHAANAAAALNRPAVVGARAQAIAHPRAPGATVFGLSPASWGRVSPAWAAWANGVAARVTAKVMLPAPGTPCFAGIVSPILAVAQHKGLTGAELLHGLAAALVIRDCLAEGLGGDPAIHLAPSAAAGLGAALGLPAEVIHRAVSMALHVTPVPASGRGAWAAHAGKVAVEAVDGAMRGETISSPAYEGEDGFMVRLRLDRSAEFHVFLPERGEVVPVLPGQGACSQQAAESFRVQADGLVSRPEQDRLINLIDRLPGLAAEELFGLTFIVDPARLAVSAARGLF